MSSTTWLLSKSGLLPSMSASMYHFLQGLQDSYRQLQWFFRSHIQSGEMLSEADYFRPTFHVPLLESGVKLDVLKLATLRKI